MREETSLFLEGVINRVADARVHRPTGSEYLEGNARRSLLDAAARDWGAL
jgi:hypothetical protein